MSDEYKDFLLSLIKICINSFISFERFMHSTFLKLLFIDIILFKECKYVSSKNCTFLVQK
jgi:hypothetical protein